MNIKPGDIHPLRLYRNGHNYTLEDVHGLTGYAPSVISRIERGEIKPRVTTKVKIARRLGAPVGELFPLDDLSEPA